MRRIINFFLTLLVLWVGSTYFSSYISINTTQTLIISTVAIFAMNIIYGLFMFISALLTPILIGCLPLISGFVVLPFLSFIELWLLNKYLPGFHIYGILTYVLLTVAMMIFSVKIKTESKN